MKIAENKTFYISMILFIIGQWEIGLGLFLVDLMLTKTKQG